MKSTFEQKSEIEKGEKGEKEFQEFLQVIERKFLKHPIVTDNHYTHWFEQGKMTLEETRHFAVQFSVFSNLFLVAQLKKMLNSDSLEGMRSAKEILANEIGVMFKNTTHSVDGGTFRFKAGHFEWLLDFGGHLGLSFKDMGKKRHGTPSTLFFCRQLEEIYGSEDASVAAGASYAIENWAAAGFWEQLISGLEKFKKDQCPSLPLGFFTWHNQLEIHHADHTQDELETIFFQPDFDREKFLKGGELILEALSHFWNGLFQDLALHQGNDGEKRVLVG